MSIFISDLSYMEKEKALAVIDNYLRGYAMNRKLLRMDRYEKEFFKTSELDFESVGEAPLARARMFEIRHFIMRLPNSDEKLLLYYHYIKNESVERCAELLGIGRSTAYRLKKRALYLVLEAKIKNASENDRI